MTRKVRKTIGPSTFKVNVFGKKIKISLRRSYNLFEIDGRTKYLYQINRCLILKQTGIHLNLLSGKSFLSEKSFLIRCRYKFFL